MNQLFNIARQKYLTGGADWTTENIYMLLLDDTYIFDDAHFQLQDIAPSARAGSNAVGSATATDGFASGNGVLFQGLLWPNPITKVVLYDKNVGDEEVSELIAFYDSIDAFPFDATGGNYQLYPDLSFGGYFRL
jgi:hypothetical protein